MNYYNLACITILILGVVFFMYWACDWGKTYGSKTYSTSLPMPTKTPPMPKCKPSRKQEECTKCGRAMCKYYKELED